MWPLLDRLWPEVWQPLDEFDGGDHPDLLAEFCRSLIDQLRTPAVSGGGREYSREVVDLLDSRKQMEAYLEALSAKCVNNEQAACALFGITRQVVWEFDDSELQEETDRLLKRFVASHNLRYDLGSDGYLHIRLPGLADLLFSGMRDHSIPITDGAGLFEAFETALSDAVANPAPGRIETAIAKHSNLVEAFAKARPSATKKTLGALCDEVDAWPHESLRCAMKALYKFASDYPGIRHAGSPDSKRRDLELGDLFGVSIAMLGLSSYLGPQLDFQAPERVFRENLHAENKTARSEHTPRLQTGAPR